MLNKKIVIVFVCIILFVAIMIGCFFISKNIHEKRRKEAQEAARNAEIESLIEEFKAEHSSITFDITYRYIFVDGEVVYYIEGDSNIEEYFSQKKKEYCDGFSSLTEYGSVEEITVYINGEVYVKINSLDDEIEEVKRTCRHENCTSWCDAGYKYCSYHKCNRSYCNNAREEGSMYCYEHD